MSRLEKLQSFLEQDPNDSFTRYAIGLEYASMKDHDAAIKTFEELRGKDANYVATYYQLAGCYREKGDKAKAEETYKLGIKVARSANDLHAASELQAALDELDED